MSKTISPIYKQIALDIANRIYHGNINEGEKLHGRSTLAGEYNVSPETIRRSIKLLEDTEVLIVNKGSGITVLSKDRACYFINRFQEIESLGMLKSRVEELIEQRKQIDLEVSDLIHQITDLSNRLKNVNPINTIEFEVPKGYNGLGKTIEEMKFWHKTGATIIGVRRNGSIIASPGPYLSIEQGDILLVVGDDDSLNRVEKFLEI
ncbi:TrkA C-terminal domain-containing protein [Clostridium frigidicarnis]|uniref:Regulatory protein, gntR family n=1 Tax=Clostridium frigidicarnis TaxID=84698 RepID=A0A1I1AWS7_9CLOT|nr:TrkA C-terminal domain-containing protein [Clostridium frigidicarnis]SFB40743.1 regulatory protein, gntR family [Clostridium frigidicarnis]